MASSSSSSSTDPRLLRQRANLQQFVVDRKASFDLLRYEPWTDDSSSPAAHVRVADSQHIPRCLGLYTTKLLPSKSFVCTYPGVLMWEELADEFSMLYHCPTAVRVDVLDYTVDAAMAARMGLKANESFDKQTEEWRVRVTLQGDPAAFGPIVNSPRGLNAHANCKLETCKPKDVDRYITRIDGKQRIASTILAFHRTGAMRIDDELLTVYDETESDPAVLRRTTTNDGLFWHQHDRQLHDSPHCQRCFSKHSVQERPDDPLYLCSRKIDEADCPIGRHRQCFSAGDRSFLNAEWFCAAHQPLLRRLRLTDIRPCTPPPLAVPSPPSLVELCATLIRHIAERVEQFSRADMITQNCDNAFLIVHELRTSNIDLPLPLRSILVQTVSSLDAKIDRAVQLADEDTRAIWRARHKFPCLSAPSYEFELHRTELEQAVDNFVADPTQCQPIVDLTSVLCRVSIQSGGWQHAHRHLESQLARLEPALDALNSSTLPPPSRLNDSSVNLLYLLTHIFLVQTDYLAPMPEDPSTLLLFDLSIRIIRKLLPAPPATDLSQAWRLHIEPFLECLTMLEYARLSSKSATIEVSAASFDVVVALSIGDCCSRTRPVHELLHILALTAWWCRARNEVPRLLQLRASAPPSAGSVDRSINIQSESSSSPARTVFCGFVLTFAGAEGNSG